MQFFILLTGLPGVGKTTLIKKLLNELKTTEAHLKFNGFYTEEVRENGNRIGFDVVTLLDARNSTLARVENTKSTAPKIGKYSVHVKEFEATVLPILTETTSQTHNILILDEIGKMELLSRQFETAIEDIVCNRKDTPSCIIATVPVPRSSEHQLLTRLRNLENCKLFTITKANRNDIYKDIFQFCLKMVKK